MFQMLEAPSLKSWVRTKWYRPLLLPPRNIRVINLYFFYTTEIFVCYSSMTNPFWRMDERPSDSYTLASKMWVLPLCHSVIVSLLPLSLLTFPEIFFIPGVYETMWPIHWWDHCGQCVRCTSLSGVCSDSSWSCLLMYSHTCIYLF
jgi:hypothetical protein